MIDPGIVMGCCATGLVGMAAWKALIKSPKNERNWMTLKDAKEYGLIGNESTGLIIGTLNGVTLSDKTSDHVGIDGPTGSGKSEGIKKTLKLNKRYSMIISDQSGELYRQTSGIRATYGPVYRLDPSEPNSSLYNPFDDILYSDNMYAELSNMFRSLVVTQEKQGSKGDPHWVDKPVEILPVYAMQLLLGDDPSRKNMAAVLQFVRSGRLALEEMFTQPSHPKCREVANSLLSEAARGGSAYLASLISVTSSPLSMWDDINVARMTSSSSFRIDELATSDKPVTIYMTAPGRDAKRLLPLYRLIRDLMTSHLLYRKLVTLRGEAKKRIVLSIIDECQQEKPEALDETLETCRKFGLRVVTGWQSLDAAEDLYGKHFLGLLKSNISYRPKTGDNVVKRLSAMSGFYEKKKVYITESKSGPLWRSSSRKVEKEWKPRLEAWDFEKWPRYGVAMYTGTGKPALVKVTDTETDPLYQKYKLPEYILPKPKILQSPWDNDVPVVTTPPHNVVDEQPFMDEHSNPGEFQDDEDMAVV